jgi:hypothetical protein
MRPRMKIDVPEPKGTEFENFDRLTRKLLKVQVESKRKRTAPEKTEAKHGNTKSKG